MHYFFEGLKVYLSLGSTDMRKSINTLAILVSSNLKLDPFSGHLFVFCNGSRKILKILYWDKNGFCLWEKKLERHRFRWPVTESEVKEISSRELLWLLEGLPLSQPEAHGRLHYATIC